MRPLRFASALALLAATVIAAGDARAQSSAAPSNATQRPRALVELFTSQGCSSCPAADRLIGELAADPSLVAITLAVDYWDYLGWKDTLALNGHTLRQRAYARSRGDRAVYTPQVVVNGVAHVLGSDRSAIERAARDTRQATPALSVPVSLSQADTMLTIALPAGERDAAPAEVWVCPTSKAVAVTIGRGENRGQAITYTNVVRRWIKAGEWRGQAETFRVPLASIEGAGIDMVTVLVQRAGTDAPRVVLGATQASIR